MNKGILIIGDSHTHAFKRLIAKSPELERFTALTFAKVKNDKMVGDILPEDLKKQLEVDSESYDAIVSFTGGNQHNSISLIKHNQSFSIADELSQGYVGGESQIRIPREAFKLLMENGLRNGDFKKLRSVVSNSGLPVYHVAATPPKKSTEHILKRPETDFVRKNIAEIGVTDADLRLQIYKIQMEITQKLCKEFGINFVELPSEVLDEDGFLAEPYYADDATHANVAFAKILVAHIESVIG